MRLLKKFQFPRRVVPEAINRMNKVVPKVEIATKAKDFRQKMKKITYVKGLIGQCGRNIGEKVLYLRHIARLSI